jgi:uncharacterized protein DUF4865
LYAMQYGITLPAGYDMSIIRERVATKGFFLDDAPGLGLKAYLIRERGEFSPTNQYAPFYLWTDVSAMSHFLWGGGGFQGIVNDFGRPSVSHWTGVSFAAGAAYQGDVATATISRTRLDPDEPPMSAVASAQQQLRLAAAASGVHSAALAVDPARWELLHFTLWASDATPVAEGQRYSVLHLSQPHIHELERAGSAT